MNQFGQLLRQTITEAVPRLHSMEEATFNHKPSADKWSKKEILGHLIDSAYNNHQRFLRAPDQEDLIFGGYDQDEWVNRNNYQNREKEEVINTWLMVNQHLGYLLDSIPDEVLIRNSKKHNFHRIAMKRIPEESESNLAYLIDDYIFHLEHHLSQILND